MPRHGVKHVEDRLALAALELLRDGGDLLHAAAPEVLGRFRPGSAGVSYGGVWGLI